MFVTSKFAHVAQMFFKYLYSKFRNSDNSFSCESPGYTMELQIWMCKQDDYEWNIDDYSYYIVK